MTIQDGSPSFLEGYSRGVPAYFAGPKTFLRAPLAGPDAAAVTVIGAPFCGWSEAADHETATAPAALRDASARWQSGVEAAGEVEIVDLADESSRRYLANPSLADAGDLALTDSRSPAPLADAIAEAATAGSVPVVLGGGTGLREIAAPALASALEGEQRPFRVEVAAQGSGDADLVLGLNGYRPSAESAARSIPAAQLRGAAAGQELDEVPEGPIYVSFDLGALDSAYASGLVRPAVGGLSPTAALSIARALGRRPLAGIDLTGLAPGGDQGGRTTWLALQILLELLAEHVATSEGEER